MQESNNIKASTYLTETLKGQPYHKIGMDHPMEIDLHTASQ